MDAARVSRRLGATEALIVYRRTREQMPAHAYEAEDAEREGVKIHWLRTIAEIDGPELKVEVMELDDQGRPHPTGRFESLEADTVVLALGQDADTEFLRHVPGVELARDGVVAVSGSLMTGCPGVFAGGDAVPAERSVTVAAGHGKAAARHIDAYLRGTVHEPAPEASAGRLRQAARLVLRRRPDGAAARAAARSSACPGSRRCSAGSTASRPPTRPGAASRAATASSATAAWARAPRMR